MASLVGRLSDAGGGGLVIRGEPGIGKSALLAAATARARDRRIRVLSAVGVQSEARLPFAGLHQLLRSVLPLAERLPARQRTALLAAFGISDEAPSELFMIGLATLELISDTAASSPVLLIADDAQWLDEPSCTVLAFVARRLAVEPAAMLIGTRDGLAGTASSRSRSPGPASSGTASQRRSRRTRSSRSDLTSRSANQAGSGSLTTHSGGRWKTP